jgi:hypothetical protein
MKLKATKYLLPTTDGRLHKEISYLISLHENKMNKGKLENRISDLEHQFKQLEHNYREACLELADRDNEKSISNSNGTEIKHPNDGGVELFKQPIESTQELFKQPLTIEQLKEGDVLVYEGDRYRFYTKGKEYVVNNLKGYLALIDDDGQNLKIDEKSIDQFTLKAKQTPDPITSTTLKTPNEWLKLMCGKERKLWSENRALSDWKLDMNQEMTFEDFIGDSFLWSHTPQGHVYWQNISNRYNN